MKPAPIPADEERRLRKLRAYQILDSETEASFDDLALLAAEICRAPVALVSLVDETRQWFKASVGMGEKQSPRDLAFCAHAILQREVFTVADARADDRFSANPLVTGAPHVRAYAGAPLVTKQGEALGTVCVIDHQPRAFSESEQRCLRVIASQVLLRMEIRRLNKEMGARYSHAAGLLASASHELRTPLNGLIAASEMLLDSDLTEEQRRWAELSRRSAEALLAAVEQLLAMGREIAESGLGEAGGR
jgi:two-component system, sensor histidine kinase